MNTPFPHPVQVWSTRDAPAERKLSYYSDIISSALDPMDVARAVSGAFDAQLTATELGPITLVHGAGSAHECVRGAEHLAKSTDRKFHFVLNRGSGWNLKHRGSVHLARGDAVLLDSVIGHYLDFSESFDIVHLILPQSWLAQWIPDPAMLAGLRIPCDAHWSRALTAFVSQLSPHTIHDAPLPAALILDQIGALLALHTQEISGRQSQPTLQARQLHDQVREYIEQHCANDSLGAVETARSLGISARAVHRALAACNHTFAAVLMEARVRLAQRLLESPLTASMSVAEIGKRCGFSNASHFARLLRRHAARHAAKTRLQIAPGMDPRR